MATHYAALVHASYSDTLAAADRTKAAALEPTDETDFLARGVSRVREKDKAAVDALRAHPRVSGFVLPTLGHLRERLVAGDTDQQVDIDLRFEGLAKLKSAAESA